MDESKRDLFVDLWKRYFGDAELPIAVFFAKESAPKSASAGPDPCIISALPQVRAGKTLCLSATSPMCGGAKRYLGFIEGFGMPDFEYFLSYGIPGKLEGERYKKSPEIVVFLAGLDTISGLFALANFDEVEPNGVMCPFGSGCASIVYHPYLESRSKRPRCVMGMFDISARPCVGENTISFAAPFAKFERMVENMDQSFLTTDSWKALRHRK